MLVVDFSQLFSENSFVVADELVPERILLSEPVVNQSRGPAVFCILNIKQE